MCRRDALRNHRELLVVERAITRGDGRLEHGLRHRCRRATGVVGALGIVELHEDHDLRRLGREEPDEARGVLPFLVSAAVGARATCGARLARDLEAREVCRRARAARHDVAEQRAHRPRRVLAHDPPHDTLRRTECRFAVGITHFLDELRLEELASIRDRRVCDRELQRRHGDLVAHCERDRREQRPLLHGPQPARRFARVRQPRRHAEAGIAQRLVFLAGRETVRDRRHADVRGELDHLGEAHRGLAMHVADGAPIHRQQAVMRIDRLVEAHAPFLEQRRGDERLERGARLERFGERRRTAGVRQCPAARQRADLARVRVEHDDVAAARVHLADRVGQRALGDVLQTMMQREHDRLARRRRRDLLLGRCEAASLAVLHQHRAAWDATQHAIERGLDAADGVAVVVDRAKQSPQAVRGRRHALQHGTRMHAAHRHEVGDIGREEAARQLHPLPVLVGGPADELGAHSLARKCGAERLHLPDFGRRDVEPHERTALHEHRAGGIEDRASRGGKLGAAGLLATSEIAPAVGLPELHPGRTTHQRDGEDDEDAMHGAQTADADHCGGLAAGRERKVTRVSGGMRMPRRSSAMLTSRSRLDASRIAP